MKNTVHINVTVIAVLLILGIMCMSGCAASASGDNKYTITTPYEYPVTRRSSEWNVLSIEERREACDVSEEILKNMTTGALVETVIAYPLLPDILAYDSLEMGLEHMSSHFGGINELKGRQDACECLQEYLDDHASDNNTNRIRYSIAESLLRHLTGQSTGMEKF